MGGPEEQINDKEGPKMEARERGCFSLNGWRLYL
jgi:hypothetical protein